MGTAAFSIGALAAIAGGLASSKRKTQMRGTMLPPSRESHPYKKSTIKRGKDALPEGAKFGPPTDGSLGETVRPEDVSPNSGLVLDLDGKEVKGVDIPRPEDLLESDRFPAFQGSVGGYFSKNTRERHAITWTSKEERWFELPIGGWALMNKGENLCYFRRKEQCIALGKGLRKVKIENYKIYRVKKNGEVVFLHPADGVFPEKVNKGRVQVNGRPFQVGMNVPQSFLKFSKYQGKSYEVDPLTTMFIRAKFTALQDHENLFPLPVPRGPGMTDEEAKAVMRKPASM